MSSSSGSTSARRLLVAGVAAAAVALLASPASAIERQHHLGLAPALAILDVKSKSTASVGIGGALHYAYGLTDAWNLTVEASSAVVAANQQQDAPETPRTRPATVDQASVGASYVIDILQWVLYIGAMGSAYRLAGGTLPDALVIPGVALSVGLDYQLTRHLAVGLGVRQHFLLSNIDVYPSYTTALLRFEYMWGY